MPLIIVQQDITRMKVDAIVNAANTSLSMGGGVCGAIFQAAGIEELEKACAPLSPIQTGDAVITPGFQLEAKYIIHAVGPKYSRWSGRKCQQLLYHAYTQSLMLAYSHQCESIAFPLISSGIYGYPKEKALQVAKSAITDYLSRHDMAVYLVIYDKEDFILGHKRLGAVKNYIDQHYIAPRDCSVYGECCIPRKGKNPPPMPSARMMAPRASAKGIEELLRKIDEPFNVTLLRLIDAKGKSDAEVYKRANIDRKLFSKIRGGNGYMPSKRTILALAIALELSLAETDDLLERAGYALSHSQVFDVIVEYFIVSGKYDIFAINEVLFQYDQPLLGTV